MKRLTYILLVMMTAFTMPVQAVQRYACDFESDEARNRWVLNVATNKAIYNNLTNKWYIGALGNNSSSGQNGLYISDDGGVSAHYTDKACWVFAYDVVTLNQSDEDYTITFDYIAMGSPKNITDGLYLLWIPMKDNIVNKEGDVVFDSVKVGSRLTDGVPADYASYVIPLHPTADMDNLNGTATWRQCSAFIPGNKCDGQPHYLAFAWSNGSMTPKQPGGMVDNIAITDGLQCNAPTDLKIGTQGTSVTLSWKGDAPKYEVSAYSYETKSWVGPKIVTETTASLSGLQIGQTDFIVRAICDDDVYSLKTMTSRLLYFPDMMCVDYLNLDKATCYVNDTAAARKPKDARDYNYFKKVSPVNFGPESEDSRHTVHYDVDEYEERTGGMAKTIPDGEMASVRLGNWEVNNEAERIEYSLLVDTMHFPVLLLKYMPILEAPGHGAAEDPRFKLDILIDGHSIGHCGSADFSCNEVYDPKNKKLLPGAAEQGWHLTPPELAFPPYGGGGRQEIVWKEWTTVGVNLKDPEYANKTLTVRLTTHDCTQGGHAGYAYFTLGCSDGKLKGMNCGVINPEFDAPDGFRYRWMYASSEKYRDLSDGSVPEKYVLSRSQHYVAGLMDDSLYVVDCMFVQDSTCYFSLNASTLANRPVAVMAAPKIQALCREEQYSVTFDASPSWVQEIDHVKGDTSVSKTNSIEYYEWYVDGLAYGWSDEIKPTFTFPAGGGDYDVSLHVSSGSCDSTIHYLLHLDSFNTRDTTEIVLCDDVRKAGYVWSEKPDTVYSTYGTDSVVFQSQIAGCDSVVTLILKEPYRLYVDTFILQTQLPFDFHGRTYTAKTIDTIPFSDTNCDSTWVLNLEIYEPLQATVKDSIFVCADDPVMTLTYDILRGRGLRYSYSFNSEEWPSIDPISEVQKQGHYQIDIPLPAALTPNIYIGTLLLEDSVPQCNLSLPFTVIVRYASSVITQRWNDVLAIRNSDYNGGFEFDSIQWYLGNSPIDGATGFNYYAGDGIHLNFGASYSALLTRRDGVKLFTCPFIPAEVDADISDMPTLVPPSSPMLIKGKGSASWYDILGRPYHMQPFNDSDITSPGVQGYYLLVLQYPSGRRTVHSILVK
ncbi:MAG: hypothetical protein J5621_05640 [Paludibacteraceae bacterium]|nr:hypothetical protein [Paludibacteraceae bacterium]